MIKVNLEKGQKINLIELDKDGEKVVKNVVEYEVMGLYQHHVLVKNKKGIRRCVTNADLLRYRYAENG